MEKVSYININTNENFFLHIINVDENYNPVILFKGSKVFFLWIY
jgi:hypothetical protein